ncbi:MAG TPA: hypothetical protein VLR26_14650 [Frankiaceae bacterium]|nr:hypothetical protein [Frankiaceae bacterium]
MAALEMVIRPAAVLPDQAAQLILAGLSAADVRHGGLWSVTTTLWQRYDRPWDGALDSKGSAVLIGSLAVVYGTPRRASITVYRASITPEAAAVGWVIDQLCDEAFGYAGLTLASCPRADLLAPPRRDPFHSSSRQGS